MDSLWSADHTLDLPRQPAKTTTSHQQSYGNYVDDDDDDRDDNKDSVDDNINESDNANSSDNDDDDDDDVQYCCCDSLSPGGHQVGSSLGQLKYVSIDLLGCSGVDHSEVIGSSECEQGVTQQAFGVLTIGDIDVGGLIWHWDGSEGTWRAITTRSDWLLRVFSDIGLH